MYAAGDHVHEFYKKFTSLGTNKTAPVKKTKKFHAHEINDLQYLTLLFTIWVQ